MRGFWFTSLHLFWYSEAQTLSTEMFLISFLFCPNRSSVQVQIWQEVSRRQKPPESLSTWEGCIQAQSFLYIFLQKRGQRYSLLVSKHILTSLSLILILREITFKNVFTERIDINAQISRLFHCDLPPATRQRWKPLFYLTEIQTIIFRTRL